MEVKTTKVYEELAYLKAKKRLKQIKGFYIHALIYFLVNIFLIFFRSQKYELTNLETYITAILWGFGLAIHAISVFMFQGWEERKTNELLKKYTDHGKTRKL